MSGFVIISQSRRRDETLFMVDRSKQKKSFWSNRLDDVMRFTSEVAAESVRQKLKFNNPSVIPFSQALRIAVEQANERINAVSRRDIELGWDGHKEAF